MPTHPISQVYIFLTLTTTLLLVSDYFVGINSESINNSVANYFSPAVATWYESPEGPGSGGACAYNQNLGGFPYYGFTAAGNDKLFLSGKGCGTCYQVRCIENSLCSRRPITITITNYCPGACNNEPFHFDLSGKAFGALAKRGQENNLRQYGKINIQYQRVNCRYKTSIIDASSYN